MMTRGEAAAAARDEAKLREDVRRVRDRLQAENPDMVISQREVAKVLGRRKAEVGEAMRWLDQAELRERAKLESLSDMPDTLLQEWDALKKRVWIAANEVSAPVIANLQRSAVDREARHEQELKDCVATLAETEDELEAECARAEAAEAALSASMQALAAAETGLQAAEARIEELRAVLSLLGRGEPQATERQRADEQDGAPTSARRGGHARRGEAREQRDGPETPDLPMAGI